MPLQHLHRRVDELAMWLGDRLQHTAEPYRPAGAEPLACFDPLPPLPEPPVGAGRWSAPSPRPARPGDAMEAVVTLPRGEARGVVVLVPPWRTFRPRLVAGWVDALASGGWEVWLAVPPDHMGRRAADRHSGERFISPDLARLRGAVEQLVLEVRVLSALATARRRPAALLGLSLGALAVALAATTAEAPASVALVAPPLDPAAVLSRTRIGRRLRRLAARAGAPLPSAPALARLLRPFDPGSRRLLSSRVFLAAGRHDGVATRRGHLPAVLGWGVVPRCYPRGHITLLFACRQVRTDLLAFLGETPAQA